MFYSGILFGLGFAVSMIVVYMFFILLPDKPREGKGYTRYWK